MATTAAIQEKDLDRPVKRPSSGASTDCDVVIVGAGPYGLSAAAHLKASGSGVTVFGQPMEFWDSKMPDGMLLRSPRAASTISDPRSRWTIEAYEEASKTEAVKRIPRETFVSYGRWFHKQLGGDLDPRSVADVRHEDSVFKITLADGAILTSRKVVVAAGVGPFRKVPAQFADLPLKRASHCYDGLKLPALGRRVAVIGAGQSSLECAALLAEGGAEVEVIARIPKLRWIGMHQRLHQLGVISKILYSKHDIGPIGISRLVAYPGLLYHFPLSIKEPIRKRAVRSAGAPWLMPRLGKVKISTGRAVARAKETGGEVQLILDDGSERRVDHVLFGTGYRVDISKYEFLGQGILSKLNLIDGYPELAAGFSTSVPGLHFIGATTARKFGPILQFVTGTEFASRELASYVARRRS
jgi:FAD-dependent urate hydroxylase